MTGLLPGSGEGRERLRPETDLHDLAIASNPSGKYRPLLVLGDASSADGPAAAGSQNDMTDDRYGMSVRRVLTVVNQSAGGIWHYACALSKALAATGLHVAMAAPFPIEPIEDADGLPVWPLGTLSGSGPLLLGGRLRRAVSHAAKVARLRRMIVSFRPDVVHLHDRFGQFDFLYWRFLKRRGVRIVYTAHDVKSLFDKSTWLDRARHREADAILVHSSNSVTDLLMDGVEKSRIVRVPHPNYLHFSSAPRMSPAEAKHALGIPPNGRAILFFGAIAPYKGLSVLIDAFAQLLRENQDLYLVIAGRPTEDFGPYARQIANLKLEQRVIPDLRYIPFEEFGKFFSAAHVVALPYQRIYQSGVLQLAYAFDRPVAVANVGGLGETVAEDCTGLVAATSDARGVAFAIRELLSDPVRAEEMGKRGGRLAATKYSWDAVADKVVRVYGSICSTLPSRCGDDYSEAEAR